MAKAALPGIPVSFTSLRDLLGKPVDDPAVAKVIAKAGKVRVDSEYIVAKEAGFEFAMSRPTGAKQSVKKLLSTLFLHAEGYDRNRGYASLPAPFAFGATRAALLAALPAPTVTWKIGPGKVPVDTANVSHDTWTIDGVEISADYRDDVVRGVSVSVPEDTMGGRDLSTHPLHFEAKPADAPPDADLVGMALLVAWAATRVGLPAKHATSALRDRAITPRAFLVASCGGALSSLDFDPKLVDFLFSYTHNLNESDGKDRRYYVDDFIATFKPMKPHYVPDSWDAVDRIAPILDARWADWQATEFKKPPKAGLYDKAKKLRDAVTVAPARAALGKVTVDAALADDLVSLIDLPLTDKRVKEVLARAGLPVGKKIDQQANPALGVAYMGTKFAIAGKKQLGIDAVWFFASKQRSYIRGLGTEVVFDGYPGPLPQQLAFGQARAAVAKLLGKPTSTYDNNDYWKTKSRLLTAEFRRDKLVEIRIGKPSED